MSVEKNINWARNLETLKRKHSEITDVIGKSNCAYIDIPAHYNTGDLLIYMGTECFFKEYNINIQYRAMQNSISEKKIQQCSTILVHGGGNFGDIYLEHHRNREKLLLKHKDKKIIFMPQSIFFNSDVEFYKTKDFFGKLTDVTLYVRDEESFETGKKLTKNTYMMPDMAHSMHPLIEESEISYLSDTKGKRILNLIRADVEKTNSSRTISKMGFDWWDLCSSSDRIFELVIKNSQSLPFFKRKLLAIWLRQVKYNVTTAVSYVNAHDIVYTDRLHGFILSYLLGKEVKLYDNTYGKIARYHNAWFENCSLISIGDE